MNTILFGLVLAPDRRRIKGNEFWSMINLDYSYILREVKLMVKEIEDKFKELTKTKN